MRYSQILLGLLSLTLVFPITGKAEEILSGNLQKQISELQETMRLLHGTVRGLQKTVESQNEIIRGQSIQIEELFAIQKDESVRISGGQKGSGVSANQPQNLSSQRASGSPKLTGLAQGFNPDIGVAGTVQAKSTQNTSDEEGNDTIALKELEVSFAHAVDPYSRLDAILTFNDNLEDQNVDIEEAYYSHWGLPFGFQTQLGKFRSKIGKQNLQHLHALDTVDYALVIQDFFGDEGLAASGVRLQNTIPNPWDIPLEISGEVLRGNNGTSFSGISRRPIFNTHVKSFFELTDDVNMELGWTTLFGDENPVRRDIVIDDATGEETLIETVNPKGQDRYGVKVYGADLTFNFLLPEEKSIKWQSELYFQNRSANPHVNKDPWGFYTLLDYRFSKRFSAGLRFDYLEPLDVVGEHHRTIGVSPYLTFWQSEFANFKLQFSHTEPANSDAKSDNAVYLQANFMIGSHKHPVQ